MKIRENLVAVMLAVVCGVMPLSCGAFEIEGVKLDDKIVLSAGGPELVLNGAGVRHKFAFIKVYVGSLYLSQKKTDRNAVLADAGPKRIGMHVLASEVTAADLITSMNNALAVNLSPHEFALIEKRMRDLSSVMSAVKTVGKGTVLHLDYIPEIGTRVVVGGKEMATIPGEDFFRAMMHIWLGNKPVDGRLRDAMLGG